MSAIEIQSKARELKELKTMKEELENEIAAIEDILKWGIANGYTFAALDENSPTVHHGVNN